MQYSAVVYHGLQNGSFQGNSRSNYKMGWQCIGTISIGGGRALSKVTASAKRSTFNVGSHGLNKDR